MSSLKLFFYSFILILYGCSDGGISTSDNGSESSNISSSSNSSSSSSIVTSSSSSSSSGAVNGSSTSSSSGGQTGSIRIDIFFDGDGQGTVTTNGQVSCTSDCSISNVGRNSRVVMEAIPDENSRFVRFEGNCQNNLSETCLLDSDVNQQLTAVFESLFIDSSTTDFSISKNRLIFKNTSASLESQTQTISITNNTREERLFNIVNVTDTVSFSPSSNLLASGASLNVNVTTIPCEQNTDTQDFFQVQGQPLELEVQSLCSNSPSTLDFAVERVYFNQSVPALDSDEFEITQTPVITNRDGLLRVFVTASEETDSVPDAVMLWRDANGVLNETPLNKPANIGTTTDEGNLTQSYNTVFDRNFFAQARDFAIMIDGENAISEAFESNNRYPFEENTFIALNDLTVPRHDVTFVPIIINGVSPNLEADASVYYNETYSLFPIEQFSINIRPQALSYQSRSDTQNWPAILNLLTMARQQDGSTNAYHGLVPLDYRSEHPDEGSVIGLAEIGGLIAASNSDSNTVAHEFGHNFNLEHAPISPCPFSLDNTNGIDTRFPNNDARTLNFGFDIITNTITDPTFIDIMGFCGNNWISAYNYNNVLNFRGFSRADAISRFRTSTRVLTKIAKQPALVVQGEINKYSTDITLILEDDIFMPPAALRATHTLKGYDAFNQEVVNLPFQALKLSHSRIEPFSVSIPTPSYQPKIVKVRIFDRDGVMVAEKNRKVVHHLADQLNPTIINNGGNVVNVAWNNILFDYVLIADAVSGQLITMDQTGNVSIRTTSTQLKISASDGFNTQHALFTVPNATVPRAR